VINTEFPFNAKITMNLFSNKDGTVKKSHWDAKGSLTGEWIIGNDTGRVENAAQQASLKENKATPTQNPETPSQTPKVQPQPQPKAQVVPPNTHIIDWSKIE